MTWSIPCPGSDRGRCPRVPGRDLPSHTPNGKVGNNAKMIRQVAVLMEVADDAEGVGGQVLAQRDVVEVLRPWKPRPAVAIDRFGPRADWSAARRRSGVELRCPIRWLKSPTTTRRALEARFSNPARPAGYSSWSSRIFRFERGPTRERDQGMQTPMTVTSPTPVRVTPETNRPGGSDAWPNHPRPPRALWTTAGPSVCPPAPFGRVAPSCPGRRWSGHPEAGPNVPCRSR